jgi:16S rRNA processing protein RimM
MMASKPAKNAYTGSPKTQGEPVYLAAGLLRRPHGVRGEIMLEIRLEHPEQFQPGAVYYVGENHTPITIRTSRPHQKGVLISFEDIHDRDEIGKFRNVHLFAATADLPALPEGEYYDYQLIGLDIIEKETGKALGKLKEIIKTGANDVYLVKPKSGKELLLPAIPDVILDIDLAQSQMSVFLLDGLVE